MDQNTEKSFGSTLAIVIIILVLAIGGYYLWKNYPGVQNTTPAPGTETNVADIEKSLEAVDVGASSELDNLESQF